jgi:hypothetical protein
VVDGATAAFDAGRRERLQALGIELLVLREVAAPARRSAPVVEDRAKGEVSGARLAVGFAGGRLPEPSQLALLRAIVAALGLRESETTRQTDGGLPTLTFGDEGIEGSAVAPALDTLRDPRAKRALWPMLRRLRRHLATERPT